MAGRFARSWSLMKASADVLRSDKSLLMFPLASSICCLLVAASFLIPIIAAMVSAGHVVEHGQRISAGGYVLLFLFYLAQYFVIIFFNTALAGAALARLRGEPASFGEGMAIARSRIANIFGYALIAATVGLVLRALQERLGLIGRLVAGFLGLAWTVATFLVVPVLASQDVGPTEAISRSVELLKRTWGENIIGNAGIGVVFGLLMFIAIVLAACLIGGAFATQSITAIIAAIVIVVVGLTLLGLIQASLQGIYAAALYRYAEDGEVGYGFDQAMLEQAFKPKK
ncbi:DUF6159 family protein [Dyella kyungheensis]|uniref:Glycerophosphoryl diester phosphodiesterase membrane domain-containing protein n=1 Tax=Dyella kyungheensis TaxID=1242174 RepID=A0ABS2JYA8_9GAMM|nr:DUF6159 family protein [Dyella kyungheensis]MBM7123340.1 hypothetical protein [Dyella kyungheensis]